MAVKQARMVATGMETTALDQGTFMNEGKCEGLSSRLAMKVKTKKSSFMP